MDIPFVEDVLLQQQRASWRSVPTQTERDCATLSAHRLCLPTLGAFIAMQQVAKLAGRLAPAAVGVAAAASSSSTTTAHAHVRPAAVATVDAPLSAKTIKEEWELADVSSDRVIFKPADIEEAASYLTRCKPHPQLTVSASSTSSH
jgi:hypothetical protein